MYLELIPFFSIFCFFKWSLLLMSWKLEPVWTHLMSHGSPHPITRWSLVTSCPVEKSRLKRRPMGKGQHRHTPSGSVRRLDIISSLGWVRFWNVWFKADDCWVFLFTPVLGRKVKWKVKNKFNISLKNIIHVRAFGYRYHHKCPLLLACTILRDL